MVTNLLDTIKPAQLHIRAFLDNKFSKPVSPAPNQMTASYTPESLSFKQDNIYETKQGLSSSSAKANFYASSARQLTVKLMFTGVDLGGYLPNPGQTQPVNVPKELDLFQRLCQRINGATHEPSYLRLSWASDGLRSSFEARLKSYEISYGLFDRTGKALIAEITATFVEAVQPAKQKARLRLSSPDLSHRHLVLAGETLPMLCLRYYGSTEPYLQVAAFNQLDDLRSLTPGQELLFPPLVRPVSSP
ncbi:MAG: hypothetical protein VKI42_09880 [Synechococcaceae cyanobacterium]|nr:hypothetical protein [Synechococcaceae cyanobacterium]